MDHIVSKVPHNPNLVLTCAMQTRRQLMSVVCLVLALGSGQASAKEPATNDASSPATAAGPGFYHEVVPALAKLGCSAGACHGSPNGKGGFRLSLRGYMPEADSDSIIRDNLGCRVDVLSPENSLLLLKPLMKVAHGGGHQLRETDAGYEILRSWIANGCRVVEPQAACTGIRFESSDQLLMSPGHKEQQLKVWAQFEDGAEKDVTHLAVFSSSDLSVVTVSHQGLAVGVGRGQAGISARFLEHWRTLYVTYTPAGQAVQVAQQPPLNEVDQLIDAQLEQLNLEPAGLCSDEQFIRRATLDVIGLLPTISEVQNFMQDPDGNRRAKWIDALLEREEYARFWALKWGDLMRVNNQQVGAAGVQKTNRWLVQAFAQNMPYDQFVRELLLAKGSTLENPAANYYRTASDLNNATETTAQVFMGVRLECCKCHNHPLEKWTQDNYYGFAAFFNRVQRKTSRRAGDMVIWMADEGEVTHPRTNRQMHPWLPGVGELSEEPAGDRRLALVDWLTDKDNEFLAAVEVNRIWSHLMGRGIVEPVDDFRDSNPPSNPKLLAALAADFRTHGFDRKRTMRLILNSRTYQSSSLASPGNKDDDKYFSHYRTRLLTAEQLLDAIGTITEQPEVFRGLPEGTRATQLPSPDVSNEFLEVFGQPKRETVCQCERLAEATLSQALQIANGKLVQDKMTAPSGRLQRLLMSDATDEQIVRELFLAAYARQPNAAELETLQKHFEKRQNRESALQDVAWALINSNEFLMQH